MDDLELRASRSNRCRGHIYLLYISNMKAFKPSTGHLVFQNEANSVPEKLTPLYPVNLVNLAGVVFLLER